MNRKFKLSLTLILSSCLLAACEPGGHGHSHGDGGHSHDESATHSHEDGSSHANHAPTKSAANRVGPHQGRVVTAAKVNWELAGGKQARLYLLDSALKPRALKPIQAELVLETPGGQVLAKFTHAKDHLVADRAYDPAKDQAMVTMTVNGKTELIDYSH